MSVERPSIVFCFPYRGVGGVSLLFLRLGEYLAATALAQVSFVDYADGFIAQHRRGGLTELIEYRDDAPVWIPDSSALVLQSITPWSLFPSLRIPAACKVVFWNCHPFNLVPTLPGFRRQMQANPRLGRFVAATLLRTFRNRMRALVRFMTDRRALVFMDKTNVSVSEEYLALSLPEPVLLPVVADSAARRKSARKIDATSGLRVAWIGRVVDMKVFILKHALRELGRAQEELGVPITMTVVGSGERLVDVQREARRHARISTRFIEHIPPAQLEDFLLSDVDLLLAMGTSALEGARLGIPTILLDVSYEEVPDGYVFSWLHEREGFSLGDLVGEEHIQQGNASLRSRIEELMADFAPISAQTRAYFEANHSVASVAVRLLGIVDSSECRYADLVAAGLMRRSLVYRLFSYLRRHFQSDESTHTGGRPRHASQ